jgi:hypothetical protein
MATSSFVYNVRLRCARCIGQLTLPEVSGSLGDLGTFLPLLVGLVKVSGLDLGTTLLFTGAYNVATGLLFDVPMPVQPMKTIAAVALAESNGLAIAEIMAAGIFVSSCVLFLGLSGLMGLATRLIPGPVIRGMQLGLGLNLSLKGVQQVWYAGGKPPSGRPWWDVDGRFLGVAAVAFTLLTVYPRGENSGSSQDDGSGCLDDKLGDGSSPKSAVHSRNAADIGAFVPQSDEEIAAEQHDVTDLSYPNDTREVPMVESQSAGLQLQEATSMFHNDKNALVSAFDNCAIGSFVKYTLLRPIFRAGDAATAACGGAERCTVPPVGRATAAIPAALILVLLGIVLTLSTQPGILSSLALGPSTPQIVIPTAREWQTGILRAGLPQLSLTVFNSVISVCQLSAQLFPDRPATPGHVATSVGMMNLAGCWFGAMPSCHGAGGLAAQVRFGARTGTAPIFLGAVKIFLSLILGSSLFEILQAFPSALLGAMLVVAGIELAAVGRGQRSQRGVAVMLFTACVSLALNNVAQGAVAGLLAAYGLAIRDVSLDAVRAFWTANILRAGSLRDHLV